MLRNKTAVLITAHISAALLALVLLLVSWQSTAFASWYAANVFPVLVHTLGRFFGLFPFSVFEIFFFGIPALIIAIVIKTAAGFFIKTQRAAAIKNAKRAGTGLLIFVSYIIVLFVLGTGINYNRESYAAHVGITVRDSSLEELVQLYHMLIRRAEELVPLIETDEDGVFVISSDRPHNYAIESMHDLHRLHGGLVGYFPRAKSLVFSRILSHMRIAGFFNPWTMEATYNGEMPPHRKPFIMNHELAHFAGHMREDEANFIAYLASRNSPSIDFRYSAVYAGLGYVLNALHRTVSRERYIELFEMLPPQLERDFAANRAFWRQFEGPVSDMANRANDAYLRANRQEDGVLSYGRMVDLMLAYYRERGFAHYRVCSRDLPITNKQ